MNKRQWEQIKQTVDGENREIHVGMIADSPWIPGYCGIGYLDFYTRIDEWFRSYEKIRNDFPSVLFLPGWWVEYGMAAEATGFGCKIDFCNDNLPGIHHLIDDMDDAKEIVDAMRVPDPRKSGLMPFVLNLQSYVQPRLKDLGEEIGMVCTRGPLTIASHVFCLSEFLMCMKLEPETAHKLLRITTKLCIRWLEAQTESVSGVRAVMVLDDVCGFLGGEDFRQFAFPYIKEVFDSFPNAMHFFHNDTDNDAGYLYLPEMGVDAFNFTFKRDIASVRRATGKICLMGNVPPLSLADKTPDVVYRQTKEVIETYLAENGDCRGLLLSAGGGLPMGAKKENIDAVVRCAEDFNRKAGMQGAVDSDVGGGKA